MRVKKYITNILVAFSQRKIKDLDISVETQQAVLEGMKSPVDLIDRSFNQYRCQNLFIKKRDLFFLQLGSFFILPLFVIIALLSKKRYITKIDAIGNFRELPEVIPLSLKQKYEINLDLWSYKFSLTLRDLCFIMKIWKKHPLSPYFLIKCVMNISRFSHMISLYRPTAIIEHAEFSFTSSVQTAYCREKGVMHIDVMHGEKRYSIRDSFFEYDSCYVWDEFYINLFKSLKCPTEQFIVEVPPSLRIDVTKHKDSSCYADYKYYLWEDSDASLLSIVKSLEPLRVGGASVKFRPHPRWCKKENLLKFISEEEIENPFSVSIIASLSNVKYVVGFGTTVLYQAYMSHINIIMDDVTYYDKYIESKNRKYMLAEKDIPLLSQYVMNNHLHN